MHILWSDRYFCILAEATIRKSYASLVTVKRRIQRITMTKYQTVSLIKIEQPPSCSFMKHDGACARMSFKEHFKILDAFAETKSTHSNGACKDIRFLRRTSSMWHKK